MNEVIYRITAVQKKRDTNQHQQTVVKVFSCLVVFCVFFFSLGGSKDMRPVWMISLPVIGLMFGIYVYFSKRDKAYEFEIYHLEIEDIEDKKEIARIRGDNLPESVLNKEIKVPTPKARLPIAFYTVMLVLDLMAGLLLI